MAVQVCNNNKHNYFSDTEQSNSHEQDHEQFQYIVQEDEYNLFYNEIKCSICLDTYKDPVITECSHTFCQKCIVDYLKIPGLKSKCPLCQKSILKKELRQDRKAGSFVQIFNNIQKQPIISAQNQYSQRKILSIQKQKFSQFQQQESTYQQYQAENINPNLQKTYYIESSEENSIGFHNQGIKNQLFFDNKNKQRNGIQNNRKSSLSSKNFVQTKLNFQPVIPQNSKEINTVQNTISNSIILTQYSQPVTQFQPPKKRGKMYILASNLEQDQQDEMAKFCKKFNAVQLHEFNSNKITHLVVNPEIQKGNKIQAVRSIKYLQALVKGVWIVSARWVINSNGFGDIQEEREHEVTQDKYGKGAAKLSRVMFGFSKLFEGMKFFVFDSGQKNLIQKKDLQNLIESSGGEVILREYNFNKRNEVEEVSEEEKQYFYILLANDDSKAEKIIDKSKINENAIVIIHKWILDSFSNAKILPCQKYLL